MKHRKTMAVTTFLALFSTFGAAHADWTRKVGAEIDLGPNLVGERCRAVLERYDTDYEFAKHRIFCGAWSEPSGELNSWTFRRNRTNSAWRDRTKYWWRPSINRRHDCEPGEDSEILDGVHVATLDCTTREGGFPYAAYVGKIENRIFFADFIPANANVIATLSGIVSDAINATEIDRGSVSRIVAGLKTRAESDPSLLYGADDYSGYRENFRLGRYLNHAKEHGAAVAAFQRALRHQQRLLGNEHSATGGTLARIGNDLRNWGRDSEAEEMFDRAEALISKGPNKNDLAELKVYRSYMAGEHGDLDAAINFADEAISLRKEYWGRDNGWIAHSIYAKARVEFDAEAFGDAEDSAEDSLRMYEKAMGRVHHWLANLKLLLARIEAADGDFDDALDYADSALSLRERLFGHGIAYAQALWRRADIHAAAGNESAAIDDFHTGVKALTELGLADRLSRDSVDPDRLADAMANRVAALQGALPSAELADALIAAAQLPRRGVSKRTISRMAARTAAASPELAEMTRELQELKTKRDDLRYDLARRSGREAKRRNADKEALMATEIEELSQRITAVSGVLQGAFPGYAGMVDPPTVTLADASTLLRPGEALIRFTLGEEHGSTLLIRDGGLVTHAIEMSRADIAKLVSQLRIGIQAGDAERFDTRRAHLLFQTLFGPLAEQLTGVQHLFIVPDEPLASLPPALLVTEAPDGNLLDYASVAWLGRTHAISLLPSISALRELRQIAGQSAGSLPFAGIGAPNYALGSDSKPTATSEGCPKEDSPFDPHVLASLAPLPETATEITAIDAAFGGGAAGLWTGPQASEATMSATKLSDYRGLAFATHGLLPSDTECGNEPGLALTPGDSQTQSSDGFLTASEIARLRLDADWVLLSACNTGTLEGDFRGESLSALTGAFFHAGSRLVLASHWAIASQPTVTLTTGTLGKSSTLGVAEALRQVQETFLQDPRLSHPAFWAPFTVYGDGAKP